MTLSLVSSCTVHCLPEIHNSLLIPDDGTTTDISANDNVNGYTITANPGVVSLNTFEGEWSSDTLADPSFLIANPNDIFLYDIRDASSCAQSLERRDSLVDSLILGMC